MSEQQSSCSVRYLPVPGYPLYEVGDDGSVWSLAYGRRTQRKIYINPDGYHRVKLSRNGVRKDWGVSSLALTAFVGPCPAGMEACHSPDRSPCNNRLSNLRWDTHAANVADKIIHGTHQIGESHSRHCFTESDVAAIDQLLLDGVLTQDEIAQRYDTCAQEIEAIAQRRLWPHVPRKYDGNEVVRGRCIFCSSLFAVVRKLAKHRRYCSERCRSKARWRRDTA